MQIMDVALFEAVVRAEWRKPMRHHPHAPVERAAVATGSPEGTAPVGRWRSILRFVTDRRVRSRHELTTIHINRLSRDVAGQNL